MKHLLILLFFTLSCQLHAQKQPRIVKFKEKEYLLYPYPFSMDYRGVDGSYYSKSAGMENDIVPYPGNLPDGEYVIYYQNESRYVSRRWFLKNRDYYKIDSARVAATFSLKNNKKEGLTAFYHKYNPNDPFEIGNYKNDVREGIWKYYGFEFEREENLYDEYPYFANKQERKKFYKNKYSTQARAYESTVSCTAFKNGIREGIFKKYLAKDSSKIILIGQYKNNIESGHWQEYFFNGQLYSDYTYADSVGTKKSAYSEYTENYQYSSKNNKIAYHGRLVNYYKNGKLRSAFHFKYGELIDNDTLLYSSGKLKSITQRNLVEKDSQMVVHLILRDYDTLGQLKMRKEAIDGKSLMMRDYIDGILYSERYYPAFYDKISNKDTLFRKEVNYWFNTKDTVNKIPTYETFVHLKTGTILHRNYYPDHKYGLRGDKDFAFKPDVASNIYFFEEIEYVGLNNEFKRIVYKHAYVPGYYRNSSYYTTTHDSTKIFVNDKPFSGEYIEQMGSYGNRKRESVKISENKIKYYTYNYRGYDRIGGTPSFGYSSKFIAYRRPKRFGIIRRKVKYTTHGNYTNGLMDGHWEYQRFRNGKVLSDNYYSKGNLHGEQKDYAYTFANKWGTCKDIVDKNIVKKAKIFRRWRYGLTTVENYVNGSEDGTFYNYYCNGQLEDKITYKDGERNGSWEVYSNDGKLKKKTAFTNDFYDGKYIEYGVGTIPRYELFFEEGTLSGEYKYYFPTGQLSEYGNLVNGYKVGEWKTFFEDGNVKYLETFELIDSTYKFFQSGYSSYSYSAFVKWPESPAHNSASGYSKQFFPTGVLASEGKMERGKRSGIWKFYNEGGQLIKQINYEIGFIVVPDKNGKIDSIPHYGTYKSWYNDGKKQSEALVLNETTKYDCYQQVSLANQDLYYIHFWNSAGEQTLKDKTGRIQTMHTFTGKTESEGEMVNGLREGYWRFWDPSGKLTKVGNYVNGKEEGIWLMGDLEGMHYLEDACFDMTDARVIQDMEMKKKKLLIYKVFYENGEIIKQSGFNVNLND